MERNRSEYVANEQLRSAAHYRSSVGLIRSADVSPEKLHERVQLHAKDATQALRGAAHVTGAIAVFDAVRLGEVA